MKIVAIISLALFGLAASVPLEHKIVGGEETTIEEYPYQLALERKTLGLIWSFSCGAVIIGPNTALTAGHCVQGNGAIRVKSGSTQHGNGVIHDVVSATAHPDYVEHNGVPDNDIAFLVVEPDFDFDETTQPINITSVEPSDGDEATITGWGVTSETSGTLPAKLRVVTVPIIDRDTCDQDYENEGGVSDGMICAGLQNGGKDSCSGDSGGPLTVNGVLAGLVSWGLGCAEAGSPGVYTNVDKYSDWVAEQLQLAKEARLAKQ